MTNFSCQTREAKAVDFTLGAEEGTFVNIGVHYQSGGVQFVIDGPVTLQDIRKMGHPAVAETMERTVAFHKERGHPLWVSSNKRK